MSHVKKPTCLFSKILAIGPKSQSLLEAGFSSEKRTPLRRHSLTTLAENKAKATPCLSFCRARLTFLILCRARDHTVHGVPKWTHQSRRDRISQRINSWTAGLSKSNSPPLDTSIPGRALNPICCSSFVKRSHPAKSSRKHFGWLSRSLLMPGCVEGKEGVVWPCSKECARTCSPKASRFTLRPFVRTKSLPQRLEGPSATLHSLLTCLSLQCKFPPIAYAAALWHNLFIPWLLLQPFSKHKADVMLSVNVRQTLPMFWVERQSLRKDIRHTRPSLMLICSSGCFQAAATIRSHRVGSPQRGATSGIPGPSIMVSSNFWGGPNNFIFLLAMCRCTLSSLNDCKRCLPYCVFVPSPASATLPLDLEFSTTSSTSSAVPFERETTVGSRLYLNRQRSRYCNSAFTCCTVAVVTISPNPLSEESPTWTSGHIDALKFLSTVKIRPITILSSLLTLGQRGCRWWRCCMANL